LAATTIEPLVASLIELPFGRFNGATSIQDRGTGKDGDRQDTLVTDSGIIGAKEFVARVRNDN
jgi:hypothetical protein